MSSSISLKEDVIGSNIYGGDTDKKRKGMKKSNERSFLEVHFDTIINLTRLRVNSYEKGLFLFILQTCMIMMTNMNNYLSLVKAQYPNINAETSAFSLMNSLLYFDIASLLGMGGSTTRMFAIASGLYMIAMTILYGVCFFTKKKNPKFKPRKYFYGRWFANLASYLVQVLSLPFTVTFIIFIQCQHDILAGDSDSCSVNDSFYVLVFVISLIGLILLIVNEWWLQLFFYNTKLYKKDATSIQQEPNFLLEWSCFRFAVAVFAASKSSNEYAFLIIFIVFQTLFSLYINFRISFTLASFTFANSGIQAAYQYACILLLSQYLAFLIDEFCRATHFFSNSDESVLLYQVIISFSLFFLTNKLKELHLRIILFKDIDINKLTASQLFLKIAMFQRLNSQSSVNTFSDSLFKGIANSHIENPCIHPNIVETCFCKFKILYDPKKRKDTPLDKILLTQNNSVFAKFIVKSWFETFLHFNQSQYINYFTYSEFLYFKMKNISLALKNLAILENKYLTPIQTFKLFRLKMIIVKHNRKRNHDAFRLNQSDKDNRNKLEIESVIPIEEQISQIQTGIKFIIKNNIKFWAYLEKANINLNDINNLAKFSLQQLDKLKQHWKETMYYLDYRKKWRFYYCWYYLYILNKKVNQIKLYLLKSHIFPLLFSKNILIHFVQPKIIKYILQRSQSSYQK